MSTADTRKVAASTSNTRAPEQRQQPGAASSGPRRLRAVGAQPSAALAPGSESGSTIRPTAVRDAGANTCARQCASRRPRQQHGQRGRQQQRQQYGQSDLGELAADHDPAQVDRSDNAPASGPEQRRPARRRPAAARPTRGLAGSGPRR